MSDNSLPQNIPGYVEEIFSLRKGIKVISSARDTANQEHRESLKITKELTEKNIELEKEIQDLKSHSTGLNEDVPERLPKHMFDRVEDEVSYLRGLIDFLLKDRQNVKTN